MKITRIEIDNYRLLKKLSLDLEDELSLVIGKNNTGKTSILTILDTFLNPTDKKRISFDDFNIDLREQLIKEMASEDALKEEEFNSQDTGIRLRITIKYDKNDNLSNISNVMMDLDPNNNFVILSFEYDISFIEYKKAKEDIKNLIQGKKKKQKDTDVSLAFLKDNITSYYNTRKYSLSCSNSGILIDGGAKKELNFEKDILPDILSFKYISAKREVSNKDSNKTLSTQTSKIYKHSEADNEQIKDITAFKNGLKDMDTKLNKHYGIIFKSIIEKVKKFGGCLDGESKIEVMSALESLELLDKNTAVVYHQGTGHKLPEYYNGLGYMNLINMIFEIEILRRDFRRKKDQQPADINLLFIEEPEAHTHPQMQYIFIKNIKDLLGDGIEYKIGKKKNKKALQCIISTHSAHIIADSDFNDIKYLKRSKDEVEAKNLKSLEDVYKDDKNQYQFLRQYLTIGRAEIFFADKAVMIEGDTERILIPIIMKKLDIESMGSKKILPLLSQNISIIEVGAYSHIFDEFISFLGIKVLIVTDIDSTKKDVGKNDKIIDGKCPVSEGEKTSNSTLNYYFRGLEWEKIKSLAEDKRTKKEGKMLITYQQQEEGNHARSFEESFIHINREWIKNQKETFKGIKNKEYFDDDAIGVYDLADECIDKKTSFALDIIYNSDKKLSNWRIPKYIKDGLLWLKKD